MKLILASGSKFRQQLMIDSGFDFTSEVSQAPEESIVGLPPAELALARAKLKAKDVAKRHRGAVVVGADSVLSFEHRSFDKATSEEEAVDRLLRMAGQWHELCNGMVVVQQDEELREHFVFQDSVRLKMRALTREEVTTYLRIEAAWKDSVACYYQEKIGIHLFEQIEGSHSSIIGLPLLPLIAALRELGVSPLMKGN